jgi:lipoprotein NlpI
MRGRGLVGGDSRRQEDRGIGVDIRVAVARIREQALRINPQYEPAFDTRGHIYEALGRKEDAIADFRKALAINPNIPESVEGLKRLGAQP